MTKHDLTFPKLLIGTHGTPWDLGIFLYVGAAKSPRKYISEGIDKGDFGLIDMERLPLIYDFHEALTTFIVQGKSQKTIISCLEDLRKIYVWADKNSQPMTHENILSAFYLWTEYLLERAYVKKEIKPLSAYKLATKIANLIAKATKVCGPKPGKSIMCLTRMKRPDSRIESLGKPTDKLNTSQLFEFGNILTSICNTLDVKTIRGELPIRIAVDDEIKIKIVGHLHQPDLDLSTINNKGLLRSALKNRQAMPDEEHLLDKYKRYSIIKLRVECELLIFIAQTGVNLSQAIQMEKSSYRWQTNGENLDVFRVYKNRRQGDIVFRCFKSYRKHFNRYLKWLDEAGLSDFSDQLFPFFSKSIVPPRGSGTTFTTTKALFKKINKPFFGPQLLRTNRINWLLRRSQNVELVAAEMSHSKYVLSKHYEKPHYESITQEIIKYHTQTEVLLSSPGPGLCTKGHQPKPINDFLVNSPKPDCISSDGCLFCDKHRDVMSFDYCLKLTSHAFFKKLEISYYHASEKEEVHPSYRVLDRIMEKLKFISEENEIQQKWVKEAESSIRAGRYHTLWDGHIQLLEVLI
ncbi:MULTISPECIES: hypothetical protein [Psychrobacter]|uniref:Tyr recombinase domain-containing protein n=1 Tax=Psychrobacter alimentarius TaxID=261164 RepID=A0ABM5ZZC7_9GAMM|nr:MULTISPECIES: hypothetical protein [Psychrobacter]AMT97422.1 hypothetical protein A3K91_1829 [Psychrobacter alimentarius]QCB30276.1 hypothetical protein E5677_04275 [Psychrobacter sp. PAMC27889]